MLKKLIYSLGSLCLLASTQAATLTPVQNVGALSTLAASNGDIVTATGYTTAGDGGGGDFVWSGSSTVTADFGLVFTGTSGTSAGRWLRTTSDVDVRMFGAKGDGVTNDLTAIQRAIDAAVANGYPSVHFGGKRYYLCGNATTNIIPNPDNAGVPTRALIMLGFQSTPQRPHIELLGEGATLYTDDEKGTQSYQTAGGWPADWSCAPCVILVKGNTSNLVIRDITIERKVTGGSPANPGNYVTWEQSNPGDVPPALTGSLAGKLAYGDHPTGDNRQGIILYPADDQEVDSIGLYNVNFIDCHRPVSVYNPLGANYDSKLKQFVMDNCQLLYPYGANLYWDGHGFQPGGGGQGVLLYHWIDEARITNCLFDGAVGGDVSNNYYKAPIDGFIFGAPSPNKAIATGNTLRHFGVEGIYFSWSSRIGVASTSQQFTMPSTSGTLPQMSIITGTGTTLGVIGGSNDIYFIGDWNQGTTNGTANFAGPLTISQITGNNVIFQTATNANPSAGTPVSLVGTNQWLFNLSLGSQSSAVISNNLIDCGPVITGSGTYAYGNPGIRVDDMQHTITGNSIINTVDGMLITGSMLDSVNKRMQGSLISDNTISLIDTVKYGVFAGAISTVRADYEQITNNKITAPHSRHITGISMFSTHSYVAGNSIIALAHDSSDNDPNDYPSYGIVGNWDGDIVMNNVTENFYYGMSSGPGHSWTPQMSGNQSINDVVGEWTLGLDQNPTLQLTATSAGWYYIGRSGFLGPFAGQLSIWHPSMAAVVDMSYSAWNDNRILSQRAFSPSGTPIIDQVTTAGAAGFLVWVHVTGSSSTPVTLSFQTSSPAVLLLPNASIDPSYPYPPTNESGMYVKTLTFINQVGANGVITGGSPGSTTPQYIGQGFIGSGNQVYVATGTTSSDWHGLAVLGNDANFGSLTAGNTTLTSISGLANGTVSAPAISFGSSSNTGLLSDAVNSIGISVSGTLVANFQNGGLSVKQGAIDTTAGSSSAPGYSFNADGDTGIYLATTNPSSLGISLDGTDTMLISGSGTSLAGGLSLSGTISVFSGTTAVIAIDPQTPKITVNGNRVLTTVDSSSFMAANTNLGVASNGDISLTGTGAHQIAIGSTTTGQGQSLTIQAGSSSGAADQFGGNLVLAAGNSTGGRGSFIQFNTAAQSGTWGGTTTNSSVTRMQLNENGALLLGSGSFLNWDRFGGIDSSWGGESLRIGADLNSTNRTDNNSHMGYIGIAHYSNSQAPIVAIGGSGDETDNFVRIGGGFGGQNAATRIIFYTGTSTTQDTGNPYLTIYNNGSVGMNPTLIGGPSNLLLAGAYNVTPDANDRFVVGSGTSDSARSVALSVNQSGTTTISNGLILSGTTSSVSIKVPKIIGNSASPTITTGTGAGGATRSASLDSTATDIAGTITINTVATPAANNMIVTVTFSRAYQNAPHVVMSPANANAASLTFVPYVATSGTNFTVNSGSTALGSAKTYQYNYIVVQ